MKAGLCRKKVDKNMLNLYRRYKMGGMNSTFVSAALNLAYNVNEIVIDQENICYFGFYPDIFLKGLDQKVK